MECLLRAIVNDQVGFNSNYIRIIDSRRRNLGIPGWLSLAPRDARKLRNFVEFFGFIGDFATDIYRLFELYYLASERAPVLTLNVIERRIATYIFGGFSYLWRFLRSAANNSPIASFVGLKESHFGSRAIVFERCYFGHCLCICAASYHRGLMLIFGLDDGAIKIGYNRNRGNGLVQVSLIIPGDPEPIVESSCLGFSGADNFIKTGVFVTCISADPTAGLGIVILVCYSNGKVEIWRETLCITDLSESLWECVADCIIGSYPYYCEFNPCGELALILSMDGVYMFEWSGANLKAIKIANGYSVDYWASSGDDVVAVQWLNGLEFVSLTSSCQLWLSRRGEMGHWYRVAQYNLEDVVMIDADITSGVSRVQYNGKNQLYIKVCGSWQLIHLKWTQRAVPECNVIALPVTDLPKTIASKQMKHIQIADFVLDASCGLIALITRDRSCVVVYTSSNFRFVQSIEPPKSHLKAAGLQFSTHFTSGLSYLTIRWIDVPSECLQHDDEYEIDHKLIKEKVDAGRRCTCIYKFSTGLYKCPSWQNQTLAEILANKDVDVDSTPERNLVFKTNSRRRWQPDSGKRLPRLSVFDPIVPEKIMSRASNTGLNDTFCHSMNASCVPKHYGRDGTFSSNLVKEIDTEEMDKRVYSMDEFTRNRRSNF